MRSMGSFAPYRRAEKVARLSVPLPIWRLIGNCFDLTCWYGVVERNLEHETLYSFS